MPDEPQDLVPVEPISNVPDLNTLLPEAPLVNVTAPERARLEQFQTALIIIGQPAGGALVCPGNQIGVTQDNLCAYAAKCELLRVQKAPQGELCPIERELVLSRFTGWCNTIKADPKNLAEDQRAVVAELTWIDVQEQRCTNILSRGEAARMTQVNVKDSHLETGEWISWERVIHSNAELLDNLHTRRRMIMKEWMLTPEQKFKAAKALGKLGKTDDLSRKQSARADKLRSLDTIDAEFTDLPDQSPQPES